MTPNGRGQLAVDDHYRTEVENVYAAGDVIGWGDNAYVFYMDVSFEETLRRHNTKPKRHEYGEEKMKEWWLEKDYLSLPNEYIIPEEYDVAKAVDYILAIVEKS